MDFAQILNELMEQRGVSAYQLWRETQIPQASIGRWKTGKAVPAIDNLQKLAEYFGVSADYLLGKTDKKNKPAAADDELTDFEMEIIRRYRAASPGIREAIDRITGAKRDD